MGSVIALGVGGFFVMGSHMTSINLICKISVLENRQTFLFTAIINKHSVEPPTFLPFLSFFTFRSKQVVGVKINFHPPKKN